MGVPRAWVSHPIAQPAIGQVLTYQPRELEFMTEPSGDVRVLVELIAKSLVDAPDEVFVEKFDDDVIELEVAETDVGKVIGRQGRTARALRALLSAAGHRAHKRYTLEIIE
jgi:predicted RNA-binding protein YlqC (UPF0109 family)